MDDTYFTIAQPTEPVLFKDKNSKFYGYAYPLLNEESVKEHIDHLKKLHKNARHFCYAYQIGTTKLHYRVNDDGEPNNSAGMPIYGQIQSFNLTNVLIVVVRYFGGVKLGVSGLINAYKTAAQLTVENAAIIEKTINQTYGLHFDYKNMNTVMRIVKEFQLNILQQDFKEQCYLQFEIRKRDTEKLVAAINSHFELVLIPLND
jgi:uncharacterized YigZ family protein